MKIRIIVVALIAFQLSAKKITIINTTDKDLGLFLHNVHIHGSKPDGEKINRISDLQYRSENKVVNIDPKSKKTIDIEDQELGNVNFDFNGASKFFLKGLLSETYWGSGHIQTIPIAIHNKTTYIVKQIGNSLEINKLYNKYVKSE